MFNTWVSACTCIIHVDLNLVVLGTAKYICSGTKFIQVMNTWTRSNNEVIMCVHTHTTATSQFILGNYMWTNIWLHVVYLSNFATYIWAPAPNRNLSHIHPTYLRLWQFEIVEPAGVPVLNYYFEVQCVVAQYLKTWNSTARLPVRNIISVSVLENLE